MARLAVAAACLWAGAGSLHARPADPPRTASDLVALADRALAQGKVGPALVMYGDVVSQVPRYAPARAGLRRALARLGSPRRAEGVLRYFLAENPTREAALLAAWQTLDRVAPFRVSATAALLPSTNVDRVASERYLVTGYGTFRIRDGGQQKSGMGAAFGVNLDWYIHPRPGHRFRLSAMLSGAWFSRAHLRFAEPGVSVGYEHLRGRAPWSAQIYLRRRAYDGTEGDVTGDRLTLGAGFVKTWRVKRGDRVTLRLSSEYQRFSEQPYFSGPRHHIGLDRSQPVGKTGRLSYGISLDRARPAKDYHRYTGIAISAGYERRLMKGLRGGIWIALGEQRYDAPFPLVGVRRHDRIASIGISAQLTRVRIWGQKPRLYCGVRRNRSNVALYTTRSIDCSMSLTVDF